MGERDSLDFLCENCKERLEYCMKEKIVEGHKVFYPLKYNNFIREQLHKYKFGKNTYIGRAFAEILIESIQDFNIKADLILCVPQDGLTEALRGFSHTGFLASEISKALGWEFYPKLLKKTKLTKRQSLSTVKERKENLKESFSVREKGLIEGKEVLVVDDVITTGATLSEVFSVLESENPKTVLGLALVSAT